MAYNKCTLPKPGKKVKQLRTKKGKGKSLTPNQRQKAITDFNNSW